MQYSFLGFSVAKMMELKLDMKDLAILRYFVDFRETGKMKAEVVGGKSYYWVNYNSMVEEMPYLELGKRAVMTRMLKLRDLGILMHYTKKEGGTFSFFAMGPKYIELISTTAVDPGEKKKIKAPKGVRLDEQGNCDNIEESTQNEAVLDENTEVMAENPQGVLENEEGVHEKEQGVCFETNTGCASRRTTKTHLLNNPSTIETNIKKYIKKDVEEVIEYLNNKINASYRANTKSTVSVIMARLNENYTVEDFKLVIDKKSKEWLGSTMEKYLTPQTLFGNKFEQYINQKIITEPKGSSFNKAADGAINPRSFNNFEAREYDYDSLEKKLLGWEK